MGEFDTAIKLTDATIKAGSSAADEAMMYAGDACRLGGRFKQAQQYYEKIIALPDTNDNKRSKDRARASLGRDQILRHVRHQKVATEPTRRRASATKGRWR